MNTTSKPLYIVKLFDRDDCTKSGYYCSDSWFQLVDKDKATKLTHKLARKVADKFQVKSLGYIASVESVE
jgi:hypothetical protein